MSSKEYTVKIIPDDGGTVHSFRMSERILKYGAFSLAAGICLFVGAFGCAVYNGFNRGASDAELGELREVNNIQQEQLLQLNKKANALKGELEQLGEVENELRRLSGANPVETADTNAYDGEGGPYGVTDMLTEIETSVDKRKTSLNELSEHIKSQQEKMLFAVAAGNNPYPIGIVPSSATPSLWPAKGVVSSPYGLRWNGSDFHPGIDIANDMGTPIVATADGTVDYAGWNAGGYGNMVDIVHGGGIMTRYAHASQVVVVAGQYVRRGQLIAYMGSTGFSTGPHVHYEVRINGQPVNPITYL